jgi:flagellar basal body P-ring formation protein FlgA
MALKTGCWHRLCLAAIKAQLIGNLTMKYLLLLTLLLKSASLLASSVGAFEDLSALDARVRVKTGAEIGQPGGAIGPLDRRLRLAKCPEMPTIDPPLYDSIAIRCVPLGWRIRLPLQNVSLAAPASTAPLVMRGDVVELVYNGNGFSASSSGTVLEDGSIGKTVHVKSSSSLVPITAIVSGAGEVSISR